MDTGAIPTTQTARAVIRKFSFALSEPKRNAVYQSVLATSQMDSEYLGMLVLAGLIALFGLLQNSEAVIIGAMLLSPLMNPILSAALALLLGDGHLGRKSAAVLALSIAGVIGITWLVAWASPLNETTPQILSRTNPNLLDLFIAFLSGLAGTLALRGSSASLTIIPGVAIAVAVVPPLAVVGYGLSTHQGSVAGGAFLLFVTNLVSIIISAALVFRLMGFRPQITTEKGRLNLVYRMAISAGILVVLSIPLLQTLRKAVSQIALRSDVEGALNESFKTPHSSVSDFTLAQAGRELTVHATLRTTRYFETPQIDAAEESLRKRFGAEAKLEVDQILVTQGGVSPERAARSGNALSGGVVRPVVQEPRFNFEESAGKMLADLQKQLEEILAGTPFQLNGNPALELASTPPLAVKVRLKSPEPLSPQTLALLASQLSRRLSAPAQLHGEADLTSIGYSQSLLLTRSRRALASQDRRNLAKLAKLVGNRPDLQLQITYVGGTAGSASPPLWREIRRVLLASGLNPSQWTLEPGSEPGVAPPAVSAPASAGVKAGPAPGAQQVPAAAVRYEFHTRQIF